MDSSPPYSSQPQLLRPSQAHLFIAPPPPPAELPPGWRWPPYHVQGIRPTNPLLQCLFKCTYCFDGTRSSRVRYACLVLGALLLVHGIIRVCIAGAAIPEANKITKDPYTRSYYPVVEFYARYINILFLVLASRAGTFGVIFGAMLPAFLLEIFPGACLIAAGVLPKTIFCALPITFLTAGIVENVVDFVGFVGKFAAISGSSFSCGLKDCGGGVLVVGLIIRTIFCIFLQFCISLDVSLWQQILLGLYATKREPPALLTEQVTAAEPEGEPQLRITGEQTDSATDAVSSEQ